MHLTRYPAVASVPPAIVQFLHQQHAGAPRRAGVLFPPPPAVVSVLHEQPIAELGFSDSHRQATTGITLLALEACW